ncbi:MAG: efflux RND transporter periplasmic adaptor subunit [Chloroflexota bacterium]|nr:efflux RND transporter periplasmic adaptor subunit [Chloroflexota bacterium]
MKKSTIRIALAGLVVVAVLVFAVALNRSANAAAVPATRSSALQAENLPAPNTVKTIGNLVSANQATLAFQASGRVKEINVKEGDQVKAGALLASVDTSILDLQVVQAQAALDMAQARLDALKNPSPADVAAAQASVASAEAVLAQLKSPAQNDLKIAKADLDSAQAALATAQSAFDRIGGDSNPFGAMTPQSLALQQASNNFQKAQAAFNARVSPSDAQLKQAQVAVEQARAQLARLTTPSPNDLKTAQAQVAQAQAALDITKQNITNTKVIAPIDGTILWIGPHVGETAAPGAPAITLADLKRMQVQIGVDENTLALIKVGQTAAITLDALPGKTLTGKVSRINQMAAMAAGIISVPATVDIDPTDAPIYPGLSATVEINIGN